MTIRARPARRRVITEVIALLAFIGLGLIIDLVTPESLLRGIIRSIIGLGTFGAWAFVIYFSRSNWREAPATRALMRMGVSLGLFFLLTIIEWFISDYPGHQALGFIIYTFMTYSIWRMLHTLRVAQVKATRLSRGRTHDSDHRP